VYLAPWPIAVCVEKSRSLCSIRPRFHFSCRLIFHDSLHESRSVHFTNMLYTRNVIVAGFSQNWLFFKFFRETFISSVFKRGVFWRFSAAVFVYWSCFFSVRASLPCVWAGIASDLNSDSL
jgi:hypothetical protein